MFNKRVYITGNVIKLGCWNVWLGTPIPPPPPHPLRTKKSVNCNGTNSVFTYWRSAELGQTVQRKKWRHAPIGDESHSKVQTNAIPLFFGDQNIYRATRFSNIFQPVGIILTPYLTIVQPIFCVLFLNSSRMIEIFVALPSKHENEHSISVKCGQFLNHLSDW
jgi:hypothetical protein